MGKRPRPRYAAQMLSHDPPLRADDFVPALWVPIARRVDALRRVCALCDRLPAQAWAAPSAVMGWSRQMCLAHLASYAAADVPIFAAIRAGAPPVRWIPDADRPADPIGVWAQRAVDQRAACSIAELRKELEQAFHATMRELAQLDGAQVLHSVGYAAHVLSAVEVRTAHMHQHAADIVNGPQFPR